MMRQHEPGFKVALVQALKSLRHRPGRQLAAALGIVIAIALFSSVSSSQATMPKDVSTAEAAEAVSRVRWLVYLSLLLCFTSITNSMLMSVTERFKEIGTLKCLGATNRFIVTLFFFESAIIGLVASLVGGLLGTLVVVVLRAATGNSASLSAVLQHSPMTILVSIFVGTLLATAAGIIPAYQASRMPAAAALRVEI